MNPARSALPPPPALAGAPCPAKETALAGGTCPVSWSGAHAPECQTEREVPHVPSRAVPGPGAAAGRGHAALGGGRCLPGEGLGLRPGIGGGCCPPGQSPGCQGGGGAAAQPRHPTDPTEPARGGAAGLEGPGAGDSCDTPGCRPPWPPAAPGSAGGPWAALGTLTPRGTPLRATPSPGARGAPSAWPPRGGWGGRRALINAGVN